MQPVKRIKTFALWMFISIQKKFFFLLVLWIELSPLLSQQEIYVKTLTPNMMVFGDGALGRMRPFKVGPHDGIRALLRRDTRELLDFSIP